MIRFLSPTSFGMLTVLIISLTVQDGMADTVIFPQDGALYVSRSDGKEPGLYVYQASQPAQPAQPARYAAPRRIGDAVKHLLPSGSGGKLRLASPGWMHGIDPQEGLREKKPMLLPDQRGGSGLWSMADYNGDGRIDVIVFSLAPENAQARIFYGRADGSHAEPFVFQVDGKDFDSTRVHSPHFVNLDDDDDLDFLHLNAEGRLIYYENRNTNSEPLYAAGRMLGSQVMRAVYPVDWDSDLLVDLLVVTPEGKIGWRKQGGGRDGAAPVFSEVCFLTN